jgi:hypothetical protein
MKLQSIRAWLVEHSHYHNLFSVLPGYVFQQTTVTLTAADFAKVAEQLHDRGYNQGWQDAIDCTFDV